MRGGVILADGERYKGRDTGYILIHPNPMNPARYAAVFSARSLRAISRMSLAYSQMNSTGPSSDCTRQADVGMFEVTGKKEIRWHILEKFNTVWGWHNGWGKELFVLERGYPKWRWSQWIVRIVREQLGADVAICESPLKFSYSALSGSVSYRDLFNNFKNDWIIKVRLEGSSLKKLLSTPFDNVSKKRAAAPIMDGLSLVKVGGQTDGAVLHIKDIKNDHKYSAALSHKLLSGDRLGRVFKEYEIIDEGYLIALLKNYLGTNSDLDPEARLESMTLNVLW